MLLGCSDDLQAPRLTRVVPSSAAAGARVDVIGERLAGHMVSVAFGGVSGELLFEESQRLSVRVPATFGGTVLLVVTVDGRVSNPLSFTRIDGTLPGPDGGRTFAQAMFGTHVWHVFADQARQSRK